MKQKTKEKLEETKMNNSALKELHLNIEKQKIDMKKHDKLGYQFDKNTFVFVMSIPLKIIK